MVSISKGKHYLVEKLCTIAADTASRNLRQTRRERMRVCWLACAETSHFGVGLCTADCLTALRTFREYEMTAVQTAFRETFDGNMLTCIFRT